MKVLIVLCHPLHRSFNAKIAKIVKETVEESGHEAVFHDLYREPFNPILQEDEFKRGYSLDEQVQRYMDELADSDGMVFIHPDWWGQMPALLKGWIDRVFRPGIAYDHTGEEFLAKELEKIMTGKKGIAFCTTDSEEDLEHHPLLELWQEKVFGYCGVTGTCTLFGSIRKSTATERNSWLKQVALEISGMVGE